MSIAQNCCRPMYVLEMTLLLKFIFRHIRQSVRDCKSPPKFMDCSLTRDTPLGKV